MRIREATLADVPALARHRPAMFRDMGRLASHHERPLEEATAVYLRHAMPRDEYLAWVAEDDASEEGRGLYESLGFTATNEMRRNRLR